MNIDEPILERVAVNARINLTEEEVSEFLPQLQEIINFFSKIDEAETKNIKPSLQPIELKNVLREDKSKICLTQEEALSNTKNKKDGYFKGPKSV